MTQVWVYGNSFKSSLIAVVVPKPEAIKDWAKSKGKTGVCVCVVCTHICDGCWGRGV